MEQVNPTLPRLFKQLGLPSEDADITEFVAKHKSLAANISLADAPFWSKTQSVFIAEELAEDAEWAPVVDSLDAMLRD